MNFSKKEFDADPMALTNGTQNAMSILGKIPGDREIILENDALDWAARIAGEVVEHERGH